MIMLGGRLPETENKRICQISGLKSGCGPLRNLSVVAYERALETVFELKNKTVVYEVVAYGRWSLMRSGRYERVDCIRSRLLASLLCNFNIFVTYM